MLQPLAPTPRRYVILGGGASATAALEHLVRRWLSSPLVQPTLAPFSREWRINALSLDVRSTRLIRVRTSWLVSSGPQIVRNLVLWRRSKV